MEKDFQERMPYRRVMPLPHPSVRIEGTVGSAVTEEEIVDDNGFRVSAAFPRRHPNGVSAALLRRHPNGATNDAKFC